MPKLHTAQARITWGQLRRPVPGTGTDSGTHHSQFVGHKPAQDLIHDICVEVALSFRNYRGDCAYTSWVYAIVSRRVHRWIRKETTYRHLLLQAQSSLAPLRPLWPEEVSIAFERVQRIQEALNALPQRERLCITLVQFNLMPVRDVARRLRISPDAVRMNICRARHHLRKSLAVEDDHDERKEP